MNRTALAMANALARALAPYDVTPQQWAVLERVWEEEGQAQQSLAERTFRDPPSTARILDRLQAKDLVVRQPDPRDRRVQLVFLTDRGKEMRMILMPLARGVLERSLDGIKPEDLALVVSTLHRIDDNLTG